MCVVLRASLDVILRGSLGVVLTASLDAFLRASLGVILRGSVIMILGVVKGALTGIGLVVRASCDPVRIWDWWVWCDHWVWSSKNLWVWSGGINECDPVEATDLERSSGCGPVEALGLV